MKPPKPAECAGCSALTRSSRPRRPGRDRRRQEPLERQSTNPAIRSIRRMAPPWSDGSLGLAPPAWWDRGADVADHVVLEPHDRASEPQVAASMLERSGYLDFLLRPSG